MTKTSRLSFVLSGAALLIVASGCAMSPSAKEARFMGRGQNLMAKKDYGRAILEFQNAAQAMPHDAEALYQLGLAYMQSRDWVSAVKAFNQAMHCNPKHAGATLKLAEIMTASGNKELIAEASTKIESLLAASPDNAEAIDTLAAAEVQLGDAGKASKRLEASLQKFPARLESSVILARLKLRQGNLAGAEEVLKQARTAAPQSAPAALALGQLYLISHQPGKAETEVRAALQLEPQNPGALLALGDIQIAAKRMDEASQTYMRLSALPGKAYRPIHAMFLYQTGQKDAAREELGKLARQDPDDRAIRSRLISLDVELNKPREARDLLKAALKRNSHDADALFQRGEIYLQAGKFTEAESDLQEVLHLRSDSAEAHFALAGVYRAQGRQHLDDSELDAALKLKPDMLLARLIRAKNFIVAGQPKSALELLDKAPAPQRGAAGLAIQHNWALLASGDDKEAQRLLGWELAAKRIPELVFQEAVLKLRQRDYLAARKDAEEALQANPEDVRAARIVVATYVERNERGKAQERLVEIAANRPKSAPLQDMLGDWYLSAGNLDAARNALQASKTADANSRASDLSLAEIDRRQNRTDDARKLLADVAASVARTNPENIRALLMLANLDDAEGNRAGAIARYRSVLLADDSNLYALNNLAYDLAPDDPDQALKLAQQAGELAPYNASVQDTLGWVYHRKGIDATALIYLKNAVAKEPTPRRQFHLAMCLLKAGEQELGQKTLKAALAKDPNLIRTEKGW